MAGGTPTRIVGLFPGQGSQWVGMGRQLLDEPPGFRHAIAQVDAVVGPRLHWTVAEELAADEEHSRLGGILALQVTLFAMEVGLAAVWAERGVRFDAVAGTSWASWRRRRWPASSRPSTRWKW